jgi:DNA processing protein
MALSMVQNIGPVRARKLLSLLGSPQKIFSAPLDQLRNIEGIGPDRARNIGEFSRWDEIERQIQIMERCGIRATGLHDQSYPAMLREIDDAPVILYMKGESHHHDRYAIAVVGSRKLTHYGASIAEVISGDLASMGFTIVSGMARGVDSLAHRAALHAGGRTLAVLGCGIDIIYPPENKILMENIASAGCIISEFPPGTPPDKENFPRRNRMISGLSLGVVVIEATLDSGALITARYAIEQGREVFAVPGQVISKNSSGTNDLIRKGAVLTRNADDIIAELAPVLKGFIRAEEKGKIVVTKEEQHLCNLLSREPKQVDDISRESGLPSSKVLGILLGLELKGAVKQIMGKRFYLA